MLRQTFLDPCFLDFRYRKEVYAASNYLLGGKYHIRYRVARINKKIGTGRLVTDGHFSRISCPDDDGRNRLSVIDSDAKMDFFFVSVHEDGVLKGLFMFPRQILIENMVIGENCKATFAIYTPWSTPKKEKCKAIKDWQRDYYVSSLNEFRALAGKLGIMLKSSC